MCSTCAVMRGGCLRTNGFKSLLLRPSRHWLKNTRCNDMMKDQTEKTSDENPANERLVTEAFRLPEQILTGNTHFEIVKDFLRASPGYAVEKIFQWEEGFVTSTGRFVRQDEASVIAKAAGQTLLFGSLVGHPIPHPGA